MEKRIKILRIIARLNIGGPAMHVLLLTSGLDSKKFLSHLVTGRVSEGEADAAHLAKEMGVDPLIIPELKRGIGLKDDFRAFLKLYRLMKDLKPDIVHTHPAKAGALGRMAAIMNMVPVRIHTFHGHVFHGYFGKLKTRLFMIIEKILARFTTRIIVISQAQLDDIEKRYRIAPPKKCSLIPVGLDLEPFFISDKKGELRRQLSIDEDTLLVGIVGRLVEVKNHRMFLQAARKIRFDAPDIKVKFLIVGDGGLRKDLEFYAEELEIASSVIFTGWRSNLEEVYKDLDVVCLTSLNEGTPLSLIEAMASGRAVVSTSVGGVIDMIIHNEEGLLSPSGDVETFSRNLLGLLRDKDRREEMGRKAKASVSERFSKERLFKDIERLYEEELRKGKVR